MFIALVKSHDEGCGILGCGEKTIVLKSRSIVDAQNELFALFGLIPGAPGHFNSHNVKTASIYEVSSEQTVDMNAQREEAARLEAEYAADEESRIEMEKFDRFNKNRKRK